VNISRTAVMRGLVGMAAHLFALGCAPEAAHAPPPATPSTAPTSPALEVPGQPAATGPRCSAPTWSYPGSNAAWGGLCASGQAQSPIPLVWDGTRGQPAPVKVTSTGLQLFVINQGFTPSVTIPPGRITFQIGQSTWEAFELHFHAKSEHTLQWPAIQHDPFDTQVEMHVKTRLSTDDTKYAVFAVLFRTPPDGSEGTNATLLPLFAELSTVAAAPVCTPVHLPSVFDPTPLISPFGAPTATYFGYSGSLTAPDCSEGKQWYVLNEIQLVSRAQIAQLQQFIRTGMGTRSPEGTNNRPQQPLNGRTPVLYGNQ
jgi:carbonic anhydrase